jgi:hypothetical protein
MKIMHMAEMLEMCQFKSFWVCTLLYNTSIQSLFCTIDAVIVI